VARMYLLCFSLFFDAFGVCGDDFRVVLATLLITTDSDISATLVSDYYLVLHV
jgi:hypothetical protein